MASEPRMPTGMSRCGFLRLLRGRRDGVEADIGEEHHAAPRITPLQPNSPKAPVFGGMKGVSSRG